MTRLQFLQGVAAHYDYLVRLAASHNAAFPRDVIHGLVSCLLDNNAYKDADALKVRAWLAVCAIKAVRYARRSVQYRNGLTTSVDEIGENVEKARIIGTSQELMEMSSDVDKAISTLEPLDQEIARGVYMGNETFETMGELLGRSPAYLRRRAMAVKRHLRDILKEYTKLQVGKLSEKVG